MNIASRMAQIAPFHVMELMARAQALEAEGRSIIHLEVGEPDFPTADPILEAALRFLSGGRVMGLFPLTQGLSMLSGLPASVAGQAYGLPVVFPILAWTTVAAAGMIILRRPSLRGVGRYRPAAPTVSGGGD